jgi:hypothetical protein
MDSCSIKGITDSVVSGDKAQTELNVRKILKASDLEMAKAASTPMSVLTGIVRATNPTYEGKKVHILDVSRSDNGIFTLKYKIGNNGAALSMEVENTSAFTSDNSNFQLNNGHLTRLYSDADYVNNYDDFEQLALDITNSPEKIMEVAEALVEADDYHNDPLHNRTLRNQLGSIVNTLVEMTPKINVHINNAGAANFGDFLIDDGNMFISKGIGGSKSLLEIYVHELYHAVTHFAITNTSTEMRKYTARMEQVRDVFLENTSEEDLVRMSGGTLTTEQGESILKHMTNPEVGLHEFVALAMTNKAVMNQLKTLDTTKRPDMEGQSLFLRLLDAVYSLFGSISRRLAGEPKGDDLQRMIWLVTNIHTAHKKPLDAKRYAGIRNLLSILNPLERKFVGFINKKIEEMKEDEFRNAPKGSDGDWKHMAKLMARSFFDEQARDILGNTLSLASTGRGGSLFAPENTLRSISRDSLESDPTQDMVEGEGMRSQNIDQQRQFIEINTSQVAKEGFSEPLTEEQEKSLTPSVLDADLSSIYFTHDIENLLTRYTEIGKAIKKIEAKLKVLTDTESFNFYKAQSELLGTYMIKGTDNIALLLNASNIAKKLGTSKEDLNVSEDVTTLIDEMTSLHALSKVSIGDRAVLLDLMKTDPDGVRNLVGLQLGHNQRSERDLFSNPTDKMKMIKGHSSAAMDKDKDVKYAPADQEVQMKKQGFKLEYLLPKHNLDSNSSQMAMYTNNRFVGQRFHRVGMRLNEKHNRGTTVTESHSKGGDEQPSISAAGDIRVMKERRTNVIKMMLKGEYDPSEDLDDSMITPVLNNLGLPKDFRYSMDKDQKIKILGMERKVSSVIGRSYAATYDKVASDSFNAKLLALIEQDAIDNLGKHMSTIGKNNKEYIRIGANSLHYDVKDFWKILPNNVKRKFPEGFSVRRDLMYSYLGYREMSITDLPLLKNMLNDSSEFKNIIKYSLQFAEKLWQELIKITKIDIIIRTPSVFIGNVVSNFVLAYMSGYSISEIAKLKYQGVKELNQYTKGLHESLKLEARLEAGVITKVEVRRLNVIKNNLLNSPVKDLVDEGFFTTIIEEMEQGNSGSGSYFNKLAKDKLKNMPKIFSDGIDLLYITENTKLFKLMEKGIQASDFAARYAQYHLMIEKGVEKEKAIKIVRDNYINYNKPNSKFLEWANQMGFVMFTKYFVRIQRVIRDYGKNHPAKVLLAFLGQEYVIGDIDDPIDQSALTKDIGNMVYNPADNLLRVFTPSTLEAVDWTLSRLSGGSSN